jgi:hypothetical protein
MILIINNLFSKKTYSTIIVISIRIEISYRILRYCVHIYEATLNTTTP